VGAVGAGNRILLPESISKSDRLLEESDDAGLDLDIDHPADYDKALRLFN
jgi:hypothetical protein